MMTTDRAPPKHWQSSAIHVLRLYPTDLPSCQFPGLHDVTVERFRYDGRLPHATHDVRLQISCHPHPGRLTTQVRLTPDLSIEDFEATSAPERIMVARLRARFENDILPGLLATLGEALQEALGMPVPNRPQGSWSYAPQRSPLDRTIVAALVHPKSDRSPGRSLDLFELARNLTPALPPLQEPTISLYYLLNSYLRRDPDLYSRYRGNS
jgi:hypothetical protein